MAETYDTITLAPETLLDKRMFVYYFDLFSKKIVLYSVKIFFSLL